MHIFVNRMVLKLCNGQFVEKDEIQIPGIFVFIKLVSALEHFA